MSVLLPRGMSTSMSPFCRMNSRAPSRVLSVMSWMKEGSKPPAFSASLIDVTMGHDGDVGAQGVLAAAKDDGVAALDAEPDGVRRDVGAGFIDDPDDPERDADALDRDAGRRRVPLDDLPHGAGQRDELFQPLRDARDALLVEHEAVLKLRDALLVEHEAVLKLRPARAGDDVLMIFGDDLCAVFDEGVRCECEHFVLFFFRRIGDGVRPLFGEAAYFGNGHTVSSLQAVRQTAR